MGHRIGIDVGGTFTDFIFGRDGREVVLFKVPPRCRTSRWA